MSAFCDKTFIDLNQQFGNATPLPPLLEAIPTLHVVEVGDFLALDLPPQEMILHPWLPKAGLCMLHAFRGIGKTHMSLGIAYAVAQGKEFLGWHAPKPRGVLYLDGEMPAATLQERFARVVMMDGNKTLAGKLCIITPDLQKSGMPDLATAEGQAIIDQYITDEIDLVIIDNLSCLMRSGKENDAGDWMPIQTWVLALRARGKSVLVIHHSGKNGAQRGCSKREDVLDTVITLERPSDYDSKQGARFIIKYEKARGFFGEDAKPFEAQLCEEESGKACWKTLALEESTYQKVVTLCNEGLSQKEIAEELKINKSNVSRHIKCGKQEGLIKKDNNHAN